MPAKPSVAEKLCLTCGLCCNGVIFADVQLQRGDDADKLESLGFTLTSLQKRRMAQTAGSATGVSKVKFPQPCSAFDGCHCRIYADRPKHCRSFECALLKAVNRGVVPPMTAVKIIEKARRRAEKVRQLLRKLGNQDERMALGLRFRHEAKRLQQSEVDASTGELFSQLTLAYHDLNLILSEKFYPGDSGD